MNNEHSMQTRNETRGELRARHYASDLADMVEAGEIDAHEANTRLAAFQDRMARDGAWA